MTFQTASICSLTAADHKAVETAVRKARDAAEGDSNDTEIEALQEALDECLRVLGIEVEDEEEDPTPCCLDPECGGAPCTFPGYAANH